jgi:PTH1 family peptidyl-tRNA hydrolase
MKLIIGLGNPGRSYKYNRHNVGSLLIDRLTKIWDIKIKRELITKSCLGKGRIEDRVVILARPFCFMNQAGETARLLLKKYDLNANKDMLVVFDDLDLELGRIRIRQSGGSGGHRGVESIIKSVGSSDFARLRIGIGRPQLTRKINQIHKKNKIVDYVLSNWRRDEKERLAEYLDKAADCCKAWITGGVEKAMGEFNPAPSRHPNLNSF